VSAQVTPAITQRKCKKYNAPGHNGRTCNATIDEYGMVTKAHVAAPNKAGVTRGEKRPAAAISDENICASESEDEADPDEYVAIGGNQVPVGEFLDPLSFRFDGNGEAVEPPDDTIDPDVDASGSSLEWSPVGITELNSRTTRNGGAVLLPEGLPRFEGSSGPKNIPPDCETELECFLLLWKEFVHNSWIKNSNEWDAARRSKTGKPARPNPLFTDRSMKDYIGIVTYIQVCLPQPSLFSSLLETLWRTALPRRATYWLWTTGTPPWTW